MNLHSIVKKALKAISSDRTKEEIVPVKIKRKSDDLIVDKDEHPRETTLEKLSNGQFHLK